MLRRHFCVSLLALCAMPAFAETTGPEPEQILKDMYARYGLADNAGMIEVPVFHVTDLMTPELSVLFTVVGDNPDGDLPPLDWDPFVNGQDFGVSKLKITGVKTAAGKTVTATFDNLGQKTTVIYDFVAMAGGWRFDDLRYPGGDTGPFSLRQFALDYLKEGPADGAPRFLIETYYNRILSPPANLVPDDLAPFTPDLEALYEKATQDRDGDLPLIDWDIFVNGQDAQLDNVFVKALDRMDYASGAVTGQTVSAVFRNMGVLTTVIYDFVRQPEGWRITDVRYPVSDIFHDGFSLRHYIETGGKEAAAPPGY